MSVTAYGLAYQRKYEADLERERIREEMLRRIMERNYRSKQRTDYSQKELNILEFPLLEKERLVLIKGVEAIIKHNQDFPQRK